VNVAITAAVITAVVTGVGWIVNHVLSERAERKRVRQAAQLSHVQEQLKKLYGPLAFLLWEGADTFEDLWNTLGPASIFREDHTLTDDELQLWLFWVDHDFMPRNTTIQRLLSTNTHLIEGGEMPKSYREFLDHHNNWRIHHERWTKNGIEYCWHSKVDWPQSFEADIIATFKALMKTHDDLIGALSESGARRRSGTELRNGRTTRLFMTSG
jgi:hypothetical protein